MNQINQKFQKFKLPILLIIILAILYIDIKCILIKNIRINECVNDMIEMAEKNKETVFKVSQIIKYNSAEAEDNSAEQNLQDISIHQYSDIAIYIDNKSDELTEKNSVKELYLDNFNIDIGYKYGNPAVYYKNPLMISKFRLIESNLIEDRLEYNVVSTNEENEESDYEKPTFFADCSNPITIGYINKNIISNYQVTKDNGLVSYDGRIFNNVDMDLEKLSPKISCTIHLKNNLDENFICNLSFDLQLENEEGSIKSGYIIQKDSNIGYYRFFKE